jgi:cell division protein FtsB
MGIQQKLQPCTRVFLPVILLALLAPLSWSSEKGETIEELRAQLDALSARLERLESEQQDTELSVQSLRANAAEVKTKTASTDRIKMNADLRYRFESIDVEGAPDRLRNRVRARVGIKADINQNTLLGFELASGSDDPVSTNQTLGDNFSSKGVNIDQAYVRFQSTGQDLNIYAGKFKNTLLRVGGNGLIWDGDLRPEGIGVKYGQGNLFINGLGTWIDESKSGNDVLLLGAQAGISVSALESAKLIAGMGYYEYTGFDQPTDNPFDSTGKLVKQDIAGNRLTADGRYVSDFELIEGFAELKFPTSLGKATVYADFVQNLGAKDNDTGYVFGTKLKVSDWSLGWAYQDIEADAVYAVLTDSDFGGGGTDAKGHKFSTSYAFNKKVKVGGTLFLNDRNVDFGTEQDYTRFMLDLSVKY